MFDKATTQRGFAITRFMDDYAVECSLQQSSSIAPHVWLGISDAKPVILARDAKRFGVPFDELASTDPDRGLVGWTNYPIPDEVHINTRMHLNPEQAHALGQELVKWADANRKQGDADE